MKLQKYFLYSIILLFFTACGGISTPTLEMSKKEGLVEVKKLLVENFGEDTEFISLGLITDNYKRCLFEIASLQNVEKQLTYMYMTNQVITTETPFDKEYENVKPLKIKDVDVDAIIEYKEKATSLILEKTPDFIAFDIKDILYMVSLDSKSTCRLKLVAKKKDTSPTIYGNRVEPGSAYFTFDFTADMITGKVVCTDGFDN